MTWALCSQSFSLAEQLNFNFDYRIQGDTAKFGVGIACALDASGARRADAREERLFRRRLQRRQPCNATCLRLPEKPDAPCGTRRKEETLEELHVEDDPFGNLADGDRVLDILDHWTRKGDLAKCQPGLIRILRHRWNWKLREEVLKRLGAVQTPSDALFHQLLLMMDDDNIYYDVRIIAAKALIQLLRNAQWTEARQEVCHSIVNVVTRLRRVPQPPLFNHVLNRVSGELPV